MVLEAMVWVVEIVVGGREMRAGDVNNKVRRGGENPCDLTGQRSRGAAEYSKGAGRIPIPIKQDLLEKSNKKIYIV